MVAKDKMNKKNKQGAAFTDDGFAMGECPIVECNAKNVGVATCTGVYMVWNYTGLAMNFTLMNNF